MSYIFFPPEEPAAFFFQYADLWGGSLIPDSIPVPLQDWALPPADLAKKGHPSIACGTSSLLGYVQALRRYPNF